MLGIIFDFHGTLINTTLLHVISWSQALRVPVEDPSLETVKYGVNQGLDSYAIARLIGLSKGDSDRVVTAKRRYFSQALIRHPELIPQAKETLEYLSCQHKLGVITLGDINSLRQVLGQAAVLPYFHSSCGRSDMYVEVKKEHLLEDCIDALGIQKPQVIYIGDTLVDKAIAQAVGVRFLGVDLYKDSVKDDMHDFSEVIPYLARLDDDIG